MGAAFSFVLVSMWLLSFQVFAIPLEGTWESTCVPDGQFYRLVTFEIHDDVFGQGVLVADFQHSEKLVEMALGESGIDSEPDLSPLLCGSNDSALRSGCGLLRSGHVASLS